MPGEDDLGLAPARPQLPAPGGVRGQLQVQAVGPQRSRPLPGAGGGPLRCRCQWPPSAARRLVAMTGPGWVRNSLVQVRLLQIIQAEFGPQSLAGRPEILGPGPVGGGLHHRHADAERRFSVFGFRFSVVRHGRLCSGGAGLRASPKRLMAGTEARPLVFQHS